MTKNKQKKKESKEPIQAPKNYFWMITLILLAPFALGMGMYFLHLYTSPQHALAKVAEALEQKDAQIFEQYVDTQSLLAEFIGEAKRNPEGAKLLGQTAAQSLASLAPDQLIPPAQAELRSWVLGLKPDGAANFSLGRLLQRFQVRGFRFAGVKEIDEVKNKATLVVRILPAGAEQPMPVELVLQHNGDNWQVVEVSRLLQLIAKLKG